MPSFEFDLGYLQAGVQEMEEFIHSKDVYGSTGASSPPGEPDYPQLTLGGLLLAQTRLHALALDGTQAARLATVEAALEKIRTHWRVAWGQKAGREFHARLQLWRDFLEEVRAKPEDHIDRYPYEVSRRVMLDLLKDEAEAIQPAELELLDALDKLLRAMFKSGGFSWEETYRREFPPEKFWYLYGYLKGTGH